MTFRNKRAKTFIVSIALVLLPGMFATGFDLSGAEDVTIGAVEDVVLLPWGVRLPARIDTGAATTSLDARNLNIKDGIAEFSLPEEYGGMKIRLPVKHIKQVSSSAGRQQRPVVELTVCIGRQKMHMDVNLTNRSHMQFPLLVGRNVIEKGFIVDVRQSKKLPPNCAEMTLP